jgi:hypothetical protein
MWTTHFQFFLIHFHFPTDVSHLSEAEETLFIQI